MNHSDKYKLIFFHYPKCAGKSVAKAIGIDTGHEDHIKSDRRATINLGFEIKGWTCKTSMDRWNTYRKFTIIRNPWDRMVSYYHYRKEGNDLYTQFPTAFKNFDPYGGDKVGPDGKDWGFKRWLMSSLSKGIFPTKESFMMTQEELMSDYAQDNPPLEQTLKSHRQYLVPDAYLSAILDSTGEFRKGSAMTQDRQQVSINYYEQVRDGMAWWNQVDTLCDLDGGLLVDNILRFEHLEDDWNEFFKSLGHEPPRLPKKNKSKHRHYSEYYDDESRDFIKYMFGRDIASFKYKFETK